MYETKPFGRPPLPRTLAGFHKCQCCKQIKPLSEFYKEARRPDGHGYRCRPCNKIWKKKYHADYRAAHPDKVKSIERARYARDREKRLEQHRESKVRHGHKWSMTGRARHIANPRKNMLAAAKTRARRKNLEFNLCLADINIPQLCPALGIPLFVGTDGKPISNSPTLDRIDNNKGYVKENVIVISYKANTIKNNASVEELYSIARFYGSLR